MKSSALRRFIIDSSRASIVNLSRSLFTAIVPELLRFRGDGACKTPAVSSGCSYLSGANSSWITRSRSPKMYGDFSRPSRALFHSRGSSEATDGVVATLNREYHSAKHWNCSFVRGRPSRQWSRKTNQRLTGRKSATDKLSGKRQ